MTTPIRGLLTAGLLIAAALVPALAGTEATEKELPMAAAEGASAETAPAAQGRRDKRNKDGGLLDDIGLGSLDEIPWDAFALAMVLSALVGAGGGFIYAGIAEPKEKAEP